MLQAISERERELREFTDRLIGSEPGSIQSSLSEMREFVHSRLADVKKLLYADVQIARTELARHVNQILLRPTERAGGRFYVASGEWNFGDFELAQSSNRIGNLEMVAGGGFEPPTFGL